MAEQPPEVRTGLVSVARRPMHELMHALAHGDTVLDQCIRRIVDAAMLPSDEVLVPFESALSRPKRD